MTVRLLAAVDNHSEATIDNLAPAYTAAIVDRYPRCAAETIAETPSLEGNNIELKVVRPESIDEIFSIADYLMDGCTVVPTLEVMAGDVVTRMLDFLNGVTYTTGGEIKNVSQGTYIITPNGINLNK